MRNQFALLVVLAGTALPLPLHAQAIAAGDSARRETIERLLVVADLERMYQAVQGTMANRLKANPALAHYADLLRDFAEKYGSYSMFKADMIQAYRETLSETEVNELIRFHQSDFGRRIMPKLFFLGTRSGEIVSQRMEAHLPELTAAMMERARTVPPL